jgi:D-alanyl-D-alanine carboxypeptidase/D-alanyl-D-alanine-endopeptidase (penicillin-binding protein 4)
VLGTGPIRRLFAGFFLLALALALAFGAAAGAATRLESALSRHMRAAGPYSGAYVVDATTGAPLYAWKAGTPRILASNAKLFTTAAALDRFGTSGVLETQVLAEGGTSPTGVLRGDLWLRGGGDPAFGNRWYVRRHFGRRAASVEALADALANAGITAIRGGVHGDESFFDRIRGVHDSRYGVSPWVGPLSALSFNHAYDSHGFQSKPASYAADRLRAALEARGISPGHAAAGSPAPDDALVVARVESLPMASLVRLTNKDSDNFFAETLLKIVGKAALDDGSTAAGARAVAAYARRSGATVRLLDGSGLDHADRASPRDVVRLLNFVRKNEYFPAMDSSLPVAGVDGTLDDRMRRGPARRNCRAKTGSLIGVSALSGWCTARSGHPIVFSFLMNGISVSYARRLQDRMVAALVTLG